VTIPVPQFQSEADFAEWLNNNPGLWSDGQYSGFELMQHGWLAAGSPEFGSTDISDVAVFTEGPQSVANIDGLAQYFFEGPFAGEYYLTNCPDAHDGFGRLFFLGTDFTKSRRDDYGDALSGLWDMLRDGSPVRKTDRAGVGTKGTRKYQGIVGRFWVAFR
jgi:hypothetical protein